MSTAARPRGIAGHPGRLRAWLAAARPATLTAGVVPVVVGTALAVADGVARPALAGAALLGAVLIQVGTNLVNDLGDFRRGADTAERLGPPRAVQRGWLTEREVAAGAAAALAGAVVVGIALVAAGGWPIALMGVASLACAVAYTAGPFPLAYVGLGDLFVLLFFGGAAVCGTYYVQARAVTSGAAWASVATGLMATAILVVNNLRDRETDARAGKRTLVVRFGERFGRAEHAVTLLAPHAMVAAAAVLGGPGWLLPLVSLPLAVREVREVRRKDGAALNPHLGSTARVGVAFGALLSLGVALWGRSWT